MLQYALLLNGVRPKTEKILKENQQGFRRNRSKKSVILKKSWIIEGVHVKNLEETLLFVDSSKH